MVRIGGRYMYTPPNENAHFNMPVVPRLIGAIGHITAIRTDRWLCGDVRKTLYEWASEEDTYDRIVAFEHQLTDADGGPW
jgi:hypothetical protein